MQTAPKTSYDEGIWKKHGREEKTAAESWSRTGDGKMATRESFMRRAISIASQNVREGLGGPFGSVVVRDGEIIGEGVNRVTSSCDPTAHAEMLAIRAASAKLNNFDLSGCDIYTSCEPCPMCLSAIYWARIERMFYGNTIVEADAIGFSDEFLYKEIALSMDERKLDATRLLKDEALESFNLWAQMDDRISY